MEAHDRPANGGHDQATQSLVDYFERLAIEADDHPPVPWTDADAPEGHTIKDPEEGVLDGTIEQLAFGCYRFRRLPSG